MKPDFWNTETGISIATQLSTNHISTFYLNGVHKHYKQTRFPLSFSKVQLESKIKCFCFFSALLAFVFTFSPCLLQLIFHLILSSSQNRLFLTGLPGKQDKRLQILPRRGRSWSRVSSILNEGSTP